MYINHRSYRTKKRGFTLLLAALIASVVLLFSSAIFSIAKKQITLASTGRDSQFAFYAADMGAECALYWDTRFHAFATTSSSAIAHVICDKNASGGLIETDTTIDTTQGSNSTGTGPKGVSSFRLDLYDPNDPTNSTHCVEVTVTKSSPPDQPTIIRADGYTVSCARKDAHDPRTLQRSVELRY